MGVGCSSDNSVDISMQDKIPSFKIILVGDPGVGKTSIFLRYIKHQFNYDYIPTTQVAIENVVRKLNVPESAVVSVTMWDLPGREDMDLRKTYFEDADAAIVVVDINDLDSIELATTWRQEVLNNAVRIKITTETDKDGVTKVVSREEIPVDPKQFPILLAGNKYDIINEKLEEERAQREEVKQIKDEETFKLALALKLNDENRQKDENESSSDGEDGDNGDGGDAAGSVPENKENVEMTVDDIDKTEEDDEHVEKEENADNDIDDSKTGDSNDGDDNSNLVTEPENNAMMQTLNPTEPSQHQTLGDDEEEKPECVQLLEALAVEHEFLGSVLVSAKDADGSVHASIQSLIRHLLQKNKKATSKKQEKEKKSKKKDFSNEEWSMKEVGLKQFDDLFKRINVFMERGHQYNNYYTLALDKFKNACRDAEVVSFIHESHCSIEDCITGLKASIGTGDDLKTEDDDEFLSLVPDPHIKIDLSVASAIKGFNTEYSAICKAILREYPTLSMALQKLDEKVSAESERAWDIMTEAGRTQLDVKKISGTIEKNRAQITLMLNQISQHLSYAENAKKKILAALIW